ncbi:MAG: cysteine hydrolase [Deltaproteobacteria bacterium]|nr:cysteine hydrolase [Deltaproteobacteria bacterium]MBI2530727.1 cysteine hydrolase [Deltaproteobacteria bacterium]
MNVNHFDLKKSALLFFDILNGYVPEPEPGKPRNLKRWIQNAIRLGKAGRAAGLPVFFAKGNHRPDNATTALILTDTNNSLTPWPNGEVTKPKMHVIAGDKSSDVLAELEPKAEDYYIVKYRWSAFFQTYLDLALRARGIDTIIVSGGSTDVGVASTLYSGRDLDYNMIVVSDACGTSHDQRAHDTLMELIFPRMARVRTTDQVIEMIEKAKI